MTTPIRRILTYYDATQWLLTLCIGIAVTILLALFVSYLFTPSSVPSVNSLRVEDIKGKKEVIVRGAMTRFGKVMDSSKYYIVDSKGELHDITYKLFMELALPQVK